MTARKKKAALRLPMTNPRSDLADFYQWLPEGSRRPCYASASLALVRPTGAALGFTCAEHLPAWTSQVHGRYLVFERDETLGG